MILDEGVRAENVASYLAAPFYFLNFALDFACFLHSLLFAFFEKFVHEHAHSLFFVLNLASLVLARDDYSRGNMGYTNGRLRFIDVLPARARRTIGVHLDILGADFDIAFVLNVGHNVHR